MPFTSTAVVTCLRSYATGQVPPREVEKTAVKDLLAELSRVAPGHSVEVRVPPYAAVQIVAGVRHRRGTPPALVQLRARTLLELATGACDWATAVHDGEVQASGERSDLRDLFPLVAHTDT